MLAVAVAKLAAAPLGLSIEVARLSIWSLLSLMAAAVRQLSLALISACGYIPHKISRLVVLGLACQWHGPPGQTLIPLVPGGR